MIALVSAEAMRAKYGMGPILCDGCDDEAVQLLTADETGFWIALCPQHLIRVEAMLRGARKSGPAPGQWA